MNRLLLYQFWLFMRHSVLGASTPLKRTPLCAGADTPSKMAGVFTSLVVMENGGSGKMQRWKN